MNGRRRSRGQLLTKQNVAVVVGFLGLIGGAYGSYMGYQSQRVAIDVAKIDADAKVEIAKLQRRVPAIDQGMVSTGGSEWRAYAEPSDTVSKMAYSRAETRRISFRRNLFEKPPSVFVAPSMLDLQFDTSVAACRHGPEENLCSVRFITFVRDGSVTRDGFDLVVASWSDSTFADVDVSWIAISN